MNLFLEKSTIVTVAASWSAAAAAATATARYYVMAPK